MNKKLEKLDNIVSCSNCIHNKVCIISNKFNHDLSIFILESLLEYFDVDYFDNEMLKLLARSCKLFKYGEE